MYFEGGEKVWNGPSRSAQVHLKCGPYNHITHVNEVEIGEYEVHVNTPYLCTHQLLQKAKAEYQKLVT